MVQKYYGTKILWYKNTMVHQKLFYRYISVINDEYSLNGIYVIQRS